MFAISELGKFTGFVSAICCILNRRLEEIGYWGQKLSIQTKWKRNRWSQMKFFYFSWDISHMYHNVAVIFEWIDEPVCAHDTLEYHGLFLIRDQTVDKSRRNTTVIHHLIDKGHKLVCEHIQNLTSEIPNAHRGSPCQWYNPDWHLFGIWYHFPGS